ncbi:MAG: CBS domain-containing protein [Chitinophagales bacterium]
MGESRVKLTSSSKQLQMFERNLLNDVHALGRMLKEGWFEIDKTRIGAEQEFCLVDKYCKPAGKNMEMMSHLTHNDAFTTELARFNMEINAAPQIFSGDCFTKMENEIKTLLYEAKGVANDMDLNIVLSGIVPTIRKFDFSMDNLTPFERYFALCQAINKLRGKHYKLHIQGIDELISEHDSPLLEAANTGFQVHLQVKPDEFVDMYNISQAITGHVLSSATNSPILFGKRLWKETRVALFTQSVDTRHSKEHIRETSPRVTFGDSWLRDSILNIYKEDIVKYRVLLNAEVSEDVAKKLESGEAPELMALKVHNSTVYRWNRPCYGISEGKAHLRIENRVLPAGPTVVDEMANAALWLGLMVGMHKEYGDITQRMDFEDAKTNFVKASTHGLDTKLYWLDHKSYAASDILQNELIPLAEEGLRMQNVDEKDIRKYMDVLNERVESGQTGSQWQLKSYSKLIKKSNKEEVLAAITASTIKNQAEEVPAHKWELANLKDNKDWRPSEVHVEEFMTKKLFTVQKEDIIELVSEMMDWQKIRYVAVEDSKGKLVGLVTSRLLLRAYMKHYHQGAPMPKSVKDIMIKEPLTIDPMAKLSEAMETMTKYQFGCLPVVDNKNYLIGIVTEQNFLETSESLLGKLQ